MAPMPKASMLQPETPITKETYREGMRRILASHRAGDAGLETARQIARLSDACLRFAFERALRAAPDAAQWLAVAPVGGYGRCQLNPYSDLDILILHRPGHSETEEAVMKAFLHGLFDMGLKLGHSTRTPEDCARVVDEYPVTTTALLEHRLLVGSRALYEEFRERFFAALSGGRLAAFLAAKLAEFEERLGRYGPAINVAQPDLKLSPGGLRDYHFALWVSLAKHRAPGLEGLVEKGILYRGKLADYERALDYVLRMRHELHFTAGRATDHLVYDWQETVAQGLGYRDEGTTLAEEQMMRNFYRAAHQLSSLAEVVANHCRWGGREPVVVECADARLPAGTLLEGRELRLPDRYWDLSSQPSRLFDLLEYLHEHPDLALSDQSSHRVSEALEGLEETLRLRPGPARRLLSLLAAESGVARTLRFMQELGLLERVLPAWKNVRNLVRKDLYHHYSVDEHLLRSVELLERIPGEAGPEEARLARLWRELPRRDLLRLAVLLHDVGKGSGRDHSLEGAAIAEQFCRHLGLAEAETERVRWLVENHLLMSELIRGADLGSHEVQVEFARKVRSQEYLDDLYLLTYVDIRAVAPGMMTAWKLAQLDRLYRGGCEMLLAERLPSRQESTRHRIRRLVERLPEGLDADALHHHLEQLPRDYALYTSSSLVARHVDALEAHRPGEPVVRFFGDGGSRPLEIIIVTEDRLGLFYLLCSACLAENLSIHDARLDHYGENLILDTLYCFARPEGTHVDGERLHLVEERIRRNLGRTALPPVQRPAPVVAKGKRGIRHKFRTGVWLSNDEVQDFTVLRVRTLDRLGILQAISGTLAHFNCNIRFARITTEGMRAVDVFYLTGREGRRLEEAARLKELHSALEEVLS